MTRISTRILDRFERERRDFFERVREAYAARVRERPNMVHIDANRELVSVQWEIVRAVEESCRHTG